jgi:hypothetical protein
MTGPARKNKAAQSTAMTTLSHLKDFQFWMKIFHVCGPVGLRTLAALVQAL